MAEPMPAGTEFPPGCSLSGQSAAREAGWELHKSKLLAENAVN